MASDFGKGKLIYKSKGFDKAEKAHEAKSKALRGKRDEVRVVGPGKKVLTGKAARKFADTIPL